MVILLLLAAASTHPSCDPARRDAYLQDAASLREPAPPPEMDINRHHFAAAEDLGCAAVVSSPDGRVRVWRFSLETLPSHDEDNATGPIRGAAVLQWQDAAGRIHLHRDGAHKDFHLDAIIDQIVPLDAKKHTYLLLGLRAYASTYPGPLPRRFAEVVQLGDDARLATGVFRSSTGQPVDVVWLRAPDPPTDKFRTISLPACGFGMMQRRSKSSGPRSRPPTGRSRRQPACWPRSSRASLC